MRRVRPTLANTTPSTSSVRPANVPSVSSTPHPVVREEEIQTSETPAVMEEIVVHNTLTSARADFQNPEVAFAQGPR